jgi:uncharacterized protein (UPF0303 family)
MAKSTDLSRIAVQEQQLFLPSFDYEVAWRLGTRLRDLAIQRSLAVVIDVRRFNQPLFYCALANTTPDNAEWIRRKTNTVARFLRSSYAIGLQLELKKTTLLEKYALPSSDFSVHGGSFPITVPGAGVIGCATVSGLPQRHDHELVVEALCLETNRDFLTLGLPALAT